MVATVSALFYGCLPKPKSPGKWTASYSETDKELGQVNYTYVLNIGESNKYSMTHRANYVKNDFKRIIDQQTGGWWEQEGKIIFFPKVCQEANDRFELEEIECDTPDTLDVAISDETWQLPTFIGKTLTLKREKE